MGTGLVSFQNRMRAIPATVREDMGRGLLEAGEKVADTQRAFAERSRDTGALIASVTVTGPGETTPAYSQPGGEVTLPYNRAAVTVGNTEVRYPHLVEFGTRNAAAKPFFWPGYRMAKQAAGKLIKKALAAGVRRAKK